MGRKEKALPEIASRQGSYVGATEHQLNFSLLV
jgi:hypothetical protein